MTDEQFRELKQMLLTLSMRVEELELHMKRQDEIADLRHSQVYRWCAPYDYKMQVEHLPEPISIPVDLKTLFRDS
ncbi:MAG: hypothetical protein AAAB35_13400 [Phyllobacterium sp.]|uniref:hypothetical protein n=1 Tax=Phyllobacterium sp. TaxID=1871046 RepID=UPI0030F1FDF3